MTSQEREQLRREIDQRVRLKLSARRNDRRGIFNPTGLQEDLRERVGGVWMNPVGPVYSQSAAYMADPEFMRAPRGMMGHTPKGSWRGPMLDDLQSSIDQVVCVGVIERGREITMREAHDWERYLERQEGERKMNVDEYAEWAKAQSLQKQPLPPRREMNADDFTDSIRRDEIDNRHLDLEAQERRARGSHEFTIKERANFKARKAFKEALAALSEAYVTQDNEYPEDYLREALRIIARDIVLGKEI